MEINNTKERLLASAAKVFAAKGFGDATIAEICQHAEANIAAVNYHFTSKENLYSQAWRRAFQRSIAAHPPDGGVAADAPAAERLRGHVTAFINRVTDPDSCEFDIVCKERANPTGLLSEIMRECIEPIRQMVGRIASELLGLKAQHCHVMLALHSIMGQCLHVMIQKRHLHKVLGFPDSEFSQEVMVDHIVRFSLAGISDMRRRIESGELNMNSKTE